MRSQPAHEDNCPGLPVESWSLVNVPVVASFSFEVFPHTMSLRWIWKKWMLYCVCFVNGICCVHASALFHVNMCHISHCCLFSSVEETAHSPGEVHISGLSVCFLRCWVFCNTTHSFQNVFLIFTGPQRGFSL